MQSVIDFECRVWTNGLRLRPAPRQPGGFTTLKKGHIAFNGAQTLTLSVRGLKTREVAVSEVEGFTHASLTAQRQLISKVLELLIVGAAVGLIMAVASLFLQGGTAELAPSDALTNLSTFFALGLGLVFVGGLLWSLPKLLQFRSLDLFTLKSSAGGQWELGVLEQQTENVVRILESVGIENQAM
jgi:hypothetical protein